MNFVKQIIEHTKTSLKTMPLLLKIALSFSALWVALIGLFAIAGVLNVIFVGRFVVNGQEVSFGEFWNQTSPLLLSFLGFGTLMGTIAYGLWSRQRWAREAVMVCVALVFTVWVVGTVREGYSDAGRVVIDFFIIGGLTFFAAWYLYFKKNVDAYFESLRKSNQLDTGAG